MHKPILATIALFFISTSYAVDDRDIFSPKSTFCLVNATNTPLLLFASKFRKQDWGKQSPRILNKRSIDSYSGYCTTLDLKNELYGKHNFTLQLLSQKKQIQFQVSQDGATGAVNNQITPELDELGVTLAHKAGDNNGFPTNTYIVSKKNTDNQVYLANWMRLIPDETPLQNIQLIGTHDSGMTKESGVSCNVPSKLAVTQQFSLLNQAKHGVRFFDVRLSGNNIFHAYHKAYHLGCTSKKPFRDVLNELVNFIKAHPSETIFLKLSHSNVKLTKLVRLLESYTTNKTTKYYFYHSNLDAFHWNQQPLKLLRGKIILLLDCEFADFLNPLKGLFSFSTAPYSKHCSANSDKQIVYDHYSNTVNFKSMYQDQTNKLQKHGQQANQLFLLSWTLTGGEIVAHVARPAAALAMLSKSLFNKTTPNIISYDFESPGLNLLLIKNNLAQLHSETNHSFY